LSLELIKATRDRIPTPLRLKRRQFGIADLPYVEIVQEYA
jgi:hypothetical protein